MDAVTIRRCPSHAKASSLAGEWYAFEHKGAPLAPSRAAEIAAHLLTSSSCKRNGWPMPKDWKRAHPSLPYQYGGLAERIIAHPLVTTANGLPTYFIEPNNRPKGAP